MKTLFSITIAVCATITLCFAQVTTVPVDPLTGRLALTERELRADGEVVPVLDVVDDAIEEALQAAEANNEVSTITILGPSV